MYNKKNKIAKLSYRKYNKINNIKTKNSWRVTKLRNIKYTLKVIFNGYNLIFYKNWVNNQQINVRYIIYNKIKINKVDNYVINVLNIQNKCNYSNNITKCRLQNICLNY